MLSVENAVDASLMVGEAGETELDPLAPGRSLLPYDIPARRSLFGDCRTRDHDIHD